MTERTDKDLARLSLLESDPDKAIWLTRDGRAIPLTKMDATHLTNTIDFLRRAFARNSQMQTFAFQISILEIKALDGPTGPKGDMSYEAASNELVEREPIEGLPIFRALVSEAKRRGLT